MKIRGRQFWNKKQKNKNKKGRKTCGGSSS